MLAILALLVAGTHCPVYAADDAGPTLVHGVGMRAPR